MVAILVNLSIPNLAQRIEIMVLKRFSGLSKLKFFFLKEVPEQQVKLIISYFAKS